MKHPDLNFSQKRSKKLGTQSGNVLFLILITVALFAGLTYAVTHSTRSAPGKIEEEQQKLDQAVLNNCEAAINLALIRLRNFGNCSDDEINYELPDGSNANPNAPADGHCNVFHPAYGGAAPCGIFFDPTCDLTTLSIGESCSHIVYAGESDGNRIYTTLADHGNGIAWNNGTTNYTTTGTTSISDGLANANTLLTLSDAGAPYQAAQLCRAYGENWYLPSRNELNLLYTNKALIGGLNGSSPWPQNYYWSSSERLSGDAWSQRSSDGSVVIFPKESSLSIRCVRRD